MKTVIISQALLVVFGSLLIWAINAPHNALSYGVGSGLVFVNFILLAGGWTLIFHKKLIALAVSIIVIKYAILGVLLYVLLHQPWMNIIWFVGGISSFMASALIYAKRQHGV